VRAGTKVAPLYQSDSALSSAEADFVDIFCPVPGRPASRGRATASAPLAAEGFEVEHVAPGLGRFHAELVHQPDGALDDMAELARTLVRALQDYGRALQVVAGEDIGGRHEKTP
jgi:hypothetical protein